MKKRKLLSLALSLIIVLVFGCGVLAEGYDGSIAWTGQGTDSDPACDKVGDGPRTMDGWIHWILTQSEGTTAADIVLGGTGSGTYSRYELNGGASHFFTPYFDLEGLEATVHYMGMLGDNPQLTISDYCPGMDYEELTVSKTAVTAYTRTHYWDIDKTVDTENGWMKDGYSKIWLYIDGSGDETATWTVDVTYDGYDDSDWNVSGSITITNTGTLDAVITDIADVLAGAPIWIACPVALPYTLAVGQTLVCTYSEAGYVEGINEASITTERDVYSASAAIIWGDPTTEVNKTVHIKDISDLFGEVALGTVTAPNNAKFTYTKDFAWADYGAAGSGSYFYANTAIIVETGQEADAGLKVNVQGYVYETAFAKGDPAIDFIPTFNRWGWTNPITEGTYTWDLWAGAAQCDTSKGTLVGSVTVVYSGGQVDVTYNMSAPYMVEETHVYAGYEMFPKLKVGKKLVDTVAPGAYYNEGGFEDQVYVIAHAVVGMPDPNFGP
ncbi:MAG: hypothetical protein SCM11_16470 [Bacillota bacterium]|nr:hypothetical protein [Bacillota bacterium]